MEVKGNFIVHGSYIDIHDNQTVNLSVDKGEVHVDKADVNESGNKPKRTDAQIAQAIRQVLMAFTVGSQWVAIYRILVDFYQYPQDITQFCECIGKLKLPDSIEYPCDYQAIQKGLVGILTKHYDEWCKYVPAKGDYSFPRQKKIADSLLDLLK